MNVNDLICVGAKPLALVDYLALEKPRAKLVAELMKGLRVGAQKADIAIVGGETAILPDLVRGFDLSAAALGVVKKNQIITGEETEEDDVIFGLPSSGIHDNGLTLGRKVLLRPRANVRIAKELLRPTRIYVREISRLFQSRLEIHALAHITGGAYSKLKRIGERAKTGFCLNKLPDPPWIFKEIQIVGRVPVREMYRTFNMGIGFVIICPEKVGKRVQRLLPQVRRIGCVTGSQDVVVSQNGEEVRLEKW
jgi:phosphoribosylformylglycinamidine cyclo-ligase